MISDVSAADPRETEAWSSATQAESSGVKAHWVSLKRRQVLISLRVRGGEGGAGRGAAGEETGEGGKEDRGGEGEVVNFANYHSLGRRSMLLTVVSPLFSEFSNAEKSSTSFIS